MTRKQSSNILSISVLYSIVHASVIAEDILAGIAAVKMFSCSYTLSIEFALLFQASSCLYMFLHTATNLTGLFNACQIQVAYSGSVLKLMFSHRN